MGSKGSSKKTKKVDENDKTKKYKTKKKKGNHPKLKKAIKIFLIIFVILCIIGAGVVAGIFLGLFGDDFKITAEDLTIENINSVVKDKDGNIIANLSKDENRKIISKSEMPEYLPKAFVSIEDERFYDHHGVDLKRSAAATVTYVFNRGNSSFGGSTITQQLVKNLTNEKDDSGVAGMLRKVKEMSKAYQVEKLISKDQILELYLNLIFLGDKAYGVEVASQYYFNKSAKDLDLAECAFLAGINHSPNYYRPFDTFSNKEKPEEEKAKMEEKIKNRTKTVLNKMKELGAITNEEEYNAAIAEVDAGLAFSKGDITTGTAYSYHTEAALKQIKQQLMEQNGWSEELAEIQLYSKGYTIYTTQDSSIQSRMEEEFKKNTYIKKSKKTKDEETGEYVHSQAAMVIIDHTTGNVVGTVGGLGTDVNSHGINRARSVRQTGSAMKPLAVIAPGLKNGIITAGTVYDDCPTDLGLGKTWPKNYYNGYKGLSTVRYAIEISQNVIPAKILSEIGPDNSIKMLKEFGITSLDDKKDSNLSLALGGLTNGVSPLEMAAAYATIANDGEYITPTFYTKVEDRNGNVVIEPKQEKRRVMSEQDAYVEKSILTQPVKGSAGTATYCAISGMDVAAKTGTTDDNYDRWLCGFTPYYTAATWYGYDYNEVVSFSGNPAGKLWDAVMTDIHKGLDKKTFEKPSGIVTATICRTSGLLATEKCSSTYTEVYRKGTEPSSKCEGHVTLTICKETGKIANEYCPDVEERTYTAKPEKEEKGKWKSNYGDKYNIPTETCTVHVKVEVIVEPPANNTIDNNTTGNSTTGGNTTGGNGGDKPNNNTTGNNTTGGNTTGNETTGNTTEPED